MDLIAILQTIRRNLLIVIPMALATVVLLAVLVSNRSASYTSDTSVVLLTPPRPPIDSGGNLVARTERGSTDNPLTRFNDSGVVVDVVARAISTPEARAQLEEQGADPRYEVTPSDSGPIGEITATADTAEDAVTTTKLVADAFVAQLAKIQSDRDIDPTYAITTLPVEEPSDPTPSYFSSIRLAVGAVGLGLVATYLAVSIAEALRHQRRRKADAPDSGSDSPEGDAAAGGGQHPRSPSASEGAWPVAASSALPLPGLPSPPAGGTHPAPSRQSTPPRPPKPRPAKSSKPPAR